jgi:F420H(2)-dependent quinone reductase
MPGGKARLPPRWFIVTFWHVHRRIVRASGGRRGLRPPRPGKYGTLRLTTTGRRSGEPRSVILGYYEDGPNLDGHEWLGRARASLVAEPAGPPGGNVELAGGVRQEVLGRAATADERERLWQGWREIDKNLDDWAARRPRETAVVVLEPLAAADEPRGGHESRIRPSR